jgi:predicted RNA-binding Zn-ribbon protein involved in translation (DUF1610 family)
MHVVCTLLITLWTLLHQLLGDGRIYLSSMSRPDRKTIPAALANLVDLGRGYLGRVRWRTFSTVAGIALATAAVVMWTPISWIPAVGVAVVAAAATISRVTKSFAKPVCYACGHDLTSVRDNEHGFVCPSCGSVNTPLRTAMGNEPDPRSIEQIEQLQKETKA